VKESVAEVLAIADTLRSETVPGRVVVVEAEATFERPPNAAFTFSVPRNGTNWKL
jgi:hypothetical protein